MTDKKMRLITQGFAAAVLNRGMRNYAIAASVVLGALIVGYASGLLIEPALRVLRTPCPCREQLGEAEASANAVALAGAVMGRKDK